MSIKKLYRIYSTRRSVRKQTIPCIGRPDRAPSFQYTRCSIGSLRRPSLQTGDGGAVAVDQFEVTSQNLPRPDLLQHSDEVPLSIHFLGAGHEGRGHFPKRKPVADLLIRAGEAVTAAKAGNALCFVIEH